MAQPTPEQEALINETARLAKRQGVMARPGLDFDARKNGDTWVSIYASEFLDVLRKAERLDTLVRLGEIEVVPRHMPNE